MKLLVIEGCDRTGKNTLIKSLLALSENSVVRHFGTAKGKDNVEKNANQYKFFDKEFQLASRRHEFEIYDPVRYPNDLYIWNRSHLGEFVYGSMYRASKPEWIFELERSYNFHIDPNVYHVLLYAEPEFLCKNDDGQSYTANVEEKEKEINLFKYAFSRSVIRNKLAVQVDDSKGNYRSQTDIFNEIKNFIFGK
jgi:thymidylate kinase